MFETKNKTTLITGGLSGIGKALAEQAAQDHNTVLLAQRSFSSAEERELLRLGAKRVVQFSKDLSQEEQVFELAQDLKTQSFQVDILINNAGQFIGGLIETQDPQCVSQSINLNLKTPILLTRLLLPSMLKRDSGRIVNNSSLSGVLHWPCASAYSAGKAGLIAFDNCLRQELRGTGVRTLLLLTPTVKTKMLEKANEICSSHFNSLSFKSVSAEDWAKEVWQALRKDKKILYPKGFQRFDLFFDRCLPFRFERYIKKRFSRKPRS